jgi:hypothetical protein
MLEEELLEEIKRMSSDALRMRLSKLKGELAEVEEQTMFMLRSTGHHIGGVARKKQERKLKELEEVVNAVKRELRKR